MKEYLKYIVVFFITQLIVQCEIKHEDQGDIEIVDLSPSFIQRKIAPLKLSFLTKDQIEYVQLKTPDQIKINEEYLRVYADSAYVILIGFRQMFLFDRKTGEFIREIGSFGRGPNEYSTTCHYNAYDYSKKIILTHQWDWKRFFEYDLNGDIVRNLNFSNPSVGEFSGQVNHLESNIYVVYYNNYKINNGKRLGLIDTKLNILKTYYHGDYSVEPRALSSGLSKFYKYQNNLMFFEMFCDTLYHVTKEKLIPRFVFYLDEFDPPNEKLLDENYFFNGESNSHIHINNAFESTRFLFIRFSFNEYWFWQATYDKKTKTTTMQQNESGIENDIDCFVALGYATSVNNEDELIGFIEAYKVVDWFKSNPGKAAELPTNLQKLKSMTSGDPPLIMIMELKR